jgi:hypothetical protein
VLGLATSAHAQNTPNAPLADTAQVVVVSERSPLGAAAMEWFIPTAGYAYAGKWSRGIPSGLVRIVGIGLVVSDQFTVFGAPPPCEGQCIVGAAILVVGTVWAMIDGCSDVWQIRSGGQCSASDQVVTFAPLS